MTSYELGVKAFNDGRVCTPHLDPALAATYVEGKVGANILRLSEWSRGWTDTNLNGKIPAYTVK